jgi:tetratricopeptide (TPR) repeat protein
MWGIEDIELRELSRQEEVCYLPDQCADAITLYIRGNQCLDSQDFYTAVKFYSSALRLYPGNARFFYNRAIAYENLGEHEKARADYARALRDDASVIRVLAMEHDEVTSLLDLDTKGIGNLAQAIYLWYKGFATGKKVPLAGIARRFGLSEAEVGDILSSVEAKLTQSRWH